MGVARQGPRPRCPLCRGRGVPRQRVRGDSGAAGHRVPVLGEGHRDPIGADVSRSPITRQAAARHRAPVPPSRSACGIVGISAVAPMSDVLGRQARPGDRRRRLPGRRRDGRVSRSATPRSVSAPSVRGGGPARPARRPNALVQRLPPDMVIHLAASVGGIGANRARPADLYLDNLLMGTFVLEAAREAGTPKTVDAGHDLLVPEAHPGALQRGLPLARLPGGDQRPLRRGQARPAHPDAGEPRPVRAVARST